MEQNKNPEVCRQNKLDITVIPFNFRKSTLLSLSFLSFDLEMGQYKLKIESDGESNLKTPIISKLCEITMVPKFQIDYNNKEINYLNTTTYPKYIITLLDINNNEKMKFNLNLLELSFLGKDLYTVTINHYPMIILEFMNGNYTTTELFQENELLLNDNFMKKQSSDNNIEDNFNIGNYLDNLPEVADSINAINEDEATTQNKDKNDRNASMVYTNPDIVQKFSSNLVNKESNTENEVKKKRKVNKRGSCFINNFEIINNQQKEEINRRMENENEKEKENKKDKNKKAKSKNKNKKVSREIRWNKIATCPFSRYFDLYLEKILFFRDDLQDGVNLRRESTIHTNKNENIENIIRLYKRKEKINQIGKLKEFYLKKEEDINKIKQKIQSIISYKKGLLVKLNEEITSHKLKYNELKEKNNYLIPIIAKQQLIYDSFLNKKMAEICFVFFNKKVKSLYFIPDLLINTIKMDNNDNIRKKIDFYNNHKKKISSMMGYITQLMIYMSKCFDIPLRYPLWLNGAKSFIIKGKKDKDKDFLPLHCDLKRDDKYGNFESGLIYLKNDFKEILNFCSMYPKIISEEQFNNKDNDDYCFFELFINFNHCLYDFVKNIQKMFA